MSEQWHFLADPHLGHSNIVKYCKRPFLDSVEEGLLSMTERGVLPSKELRVSPESTKKMTDTIIDSINATVMAKDHLVIAGDFCWTPKQNRYAVAAAYRNRINCQNIYLIWGNHDDKQISSLFKSCFDHYNFNIEGQNVFVSHYPCRSWDKAFHGSWMLYGHVHDMYGSEDNGSLMPYEKHVFETGFSSVLSECGIEGEKNKEAVDKLVSVCESLKGIDYTLDIGVDNRVRGTHIPFGTPWSMEDVRSYMLSKKDRWEERKKQISSFLSSF